MFDTWWTNKENFKEKDLASYKEILIKTHSIYQHNNPSTKNQSLVSVTSGKIWYLKFGKKLKHLK